MEYSQQSEVVCSFTPQSSNSSEEDVPGALLNVRKPEYLTVRNCQFVPASCSSHKVDACT